MLKDSEEATEEIKFMGTAGDGAVLKRGWKSNLMRELAGCT